jgi:hypothetical protein
MALTLHEALDQAVIVIDADAFERSQKDPRVKDLFKGGQALHAQLNAKKASFYRSRASRSTAAMSRLEAFVIVSSCSLIWALRGSRRRSGRTSVLKTEFAIWDMRCAGGFCGSAV